MQVVNLLLHNGRFAKTQNFFVFHSIEITVVHLHPEISRKEVKPLRLRQVESDKTVHFRAMGSPSTTRRFSVSRIISCRTIPLHCHSLRETHSPITRHASSARDSSSTVSRLRNNGSKHPNGGSGRTKENICRRSHEWIRTSKACFSVWVGTVGSSLRQFPVHYFPVTKNLPVFSVTTIRKSVESFSFAFPGAEPAAKENGTAMPIFS